MKLAIPPAAAALALLVLAPLPIAARSDQPIETPFQAAGHIRMSLSPAGYRVVGGPQNKVRITWRVRRSELESQVHADATVRGNTAVITTRAPRSGVDFTIEVPARSDLDIELSAGDLDIRAVEGSKRIDSWAGDVTVDVGKAEQVPNRRCDRSGRGPVGSALQCLDRWTVAVPQLVGLGPVRPPGQALCGGFDPPLVPPAVFVQTSGASSPSENI